MKQGCILQQARTWKQYTKRKKQSKIKDRGKKKIGGPTHEFHHSNDRRLKGKTKAKQRRNHKVNNLRTFPGTKGHKLWFQTVHRVTSKSEEEQRRAPGHTVRKFQNT